MVARGSWGQQQQQQQQQQQRRRRPLLGSRRLWGLRAALCVMCLYAFVELGLSSPPPHIKLLLPDKSSWSWLGPRQEQPQQHSDARRALTLESQADNASTSTAAGPVHAHPGRYYSQPPLPPPREWGGGQPDGVWIVPNLCIEDLPAGQAPQQLVVTRPDGERFVSVLDRRLVAYAQAREGPLVHRPGAHYGERHVWEVQQNKPPVPANYTYHNRTAYLVTWSCEAHTFHLIHDTLAPLARTMRRLGHLPAPAAAAAGAAAAGANGSLASSHDHRGFELEREPHDRVALLYQYDSRGVGGFEPSCHGLGREDLFYALPVGTDHDAWFRWPSGTCFREAVLGLDTGLEAEDWRAFRRHVWRWVGKMGPGQGRQTVCPPEDGRQLLIVDRRERRRILNVQELVEEAQAMRLVLPDGNTTTAFDSVRVLYLEDVALWEQLRAFRCADMAVMLHGAATAYGLFMSRGSTLLQVGVGGFPTPLRFGAYQLYCDVAGVAYEVFREDAFRVNPKVQYRERPRARVLESEEEVLGAAHGGNEWVLRFMDVQLSVQAFRQAILTHLTKRRPRRAAGASGGA